MAMLDGLLGQIAGQVDIGNLAEKLGISPEQAAGGVAALAQAHVAPGDTVEDAAASSGLPTDVIQQIMNQIGGEGSLAQYAQMLTAGQGEGGVMDALGGLASGLMGGGKN